MRIGLYGGSFDPVHLGHLLVAQAAREELGLSRIHFIPAAQSPFKPDRQLAPASVRVCLLRLALAGFHWCEVDEQELERGGVSYTVDTVRRYKSQDPASDLFYLIGADHAGQLHKWREAEQLARLLTFVIIPRPGEQDVPPPSFVKAVTLKGFPLGVSSSQIRARVKAGLPIDLLTGPAVSEAVRNNRLYL